MPDPLVHASYLGLKASYILAGFIGGVVSLSFIKELTTFQAILAVLAGAAGANYLTPTALHLLPWIEEPLAASFFIGLTAMNVIPGVVNLSKRFRNNPQDFIGGSK
jgi:hypothetical protein